MKKFALITVSILLGLFVLAGCDMLSPGGSVGGTEGPGTETGTEQTPLEQIEAKYAKVSEAQTVTKKIEITSQTGMLQYASAKTYTKKGTSGYQVTGSEKRLNLLSSGKAEAYTETQIEETRRAGTFTPQLELDELYFTNSTVTEGTLEATVLDSSVETVLGLGSELSAPVHGLQMKIVTDEAHVTEFVMSYASDGSNVSITMQFTY